MEVILLEKIHNLGELGQQVNVKPGYGRNYLIPQKKAVPASPENIKKFEVQRIDLEKREAEKLELAKARAEALSQLTVSVEANADEEGKLFGSVGVVDLAKAMTEAGQEVQKSEIRLPEGPLHNVGEYEVDVQVHSDIVATVKVTIVPSEKS